MANGEQKTVTAVTVVHPSQTATGASEAPGLQTDSAGATTNMRREFLAAMGGAVVAMVV